LWTATQITLALQMVAMEVKQTRALAVAVTQLWAATQVTLAATA
jgi:hypothetical protein